MNIPIFFEQFSQILLDEHKNQIEASYQFHKQYENIGKIKSIYGEHYTNCPWAYDDATEGQDTCGCHDVQRCNQEIQDLMKFYIRSTRNSCKECRKGFDLF